jgi:putative inorganic carbon (HCO3(-)) transporter
MALPGRLTMGWSQTPSISALPILIATTLGAIGLGLAVALPTLELSAGVAVSTLVVGLALVDPLAALAALLIALPISSLLEVETGDFSITAIEPLMALLVLTWLARGLARRDLALAGGRLMLSLALVLLALLASSLMADRLGLAYKEIIKWLELVTVFLFSVAYLKTERRQQVILSALFLAGTAEALYGVFQYVTGQGPSAFTLGEALRAYGHFEQPNPFAGYLATILPLGVALAVRRRPRAFAILAAVAACSAGAGILLSLSRGAWVGVVLALAVMLATWSQASRRWLAPAAGGVAVLILLTASSVLPAGWSDRLVAVVENFGIFDVRTVQVTSENFAVVERMAHWQAAWYMLLDHPILGVGAGNYPAAYDSYSLPGWREALGHAHNYYLNMAAEAGLVGAAALGLLMVQIYRSIASGLKASPSGTYRRALLVGLLGSFVVLTVHNLFDNLLVHGMQVQVGLLMGLLVAATDPPT